MEEAHRTHKEPVWGWVGLVVPEFQKLAARLARLAPEKGYVVTPWSSRSRSDWTA